MKNNTPKNKDNKNENYVNSSSSERTDKRRGFSSLMEKNWFVFILSLLIAFSVWVIVAMYASPEESYTVYSVPIKINTDDTIVSENGFENFWQSDTTVDVTVNGPRYLVTSITADDIQVNASLSKVSEAGLSTLTLRTTLLHYANEIDVTSLSKTSVQVYFDVKEEKTFDVTMDQTGVTEHIAEGYRYKDYELPVSTVTLSGPRTEIEKIVSVSADPQYSSSMLYESTVLPAALNLVGNTAADTVSVNKYISTDGIDFNVKININKVATMKTAVKFKGTAGGAAQAKITPNTVDVLIDTGVGYTGGEVPIFTVDYSSLKEGENTYTLDGQSVVLPDGVTLQDKNQTFEITITYTLTG